MRIQLHKRVQKTTEHGNADYLWRFYSGKTVTDLVHETSLCEIQQLDTLHFDSQIMARKRLKLIVWDQY